MEALEVMSVSKSYGAIEALDDVSLSIEPGRIHGLLGPNGAGKTTLVSIIAGLRRPDSGVVRVAGVDVKSYPDRARRHLGLAPQEIGVYLSLTVKENLEFFASLRGLRGELKARAVEDVVEYFDLGQILFRRVRELSGGEKRRLHSSIALLGSPEVVLMDEPTAGLDVASRLTLLTSLRGIAKSGSAVLYSTHYLQEAETICDSVSILDRGKLTLNGRIEDLLSLHGGASSVEFSIPAGRADELIPQLISIGASVENGRARLSSTSPADDLSSLLQIVGQDLLSEEVRVVKPSLETLFLKLTSKAVGD